jgi:myo-inositol-1(or 4)-monophosphatase
MRGELDVFVRTLAKARAVVLRSENKVAQKRANIQTTADLIAQQSVIDSFKKSRISCTLYSEELTEPLRMGEGKYEIVLDPIDGSFSYLHGIKIFVSIAMIVLEDRKVKFSFVQSLDSKDLYHCDTKAAYLNGKKIVCNTKKVEEPYAITGFAGNKDTAHFASKLAKIPSSYYFFNDGGPKFSALVATNTFDVAMEFAPTKFQELAGAFIAQKAGAFVETLEGGPIQIDPLLHQTMITSRSEKLLREIQKVLV